MATPLKSFDQRLGLVPLLFAFWALFWVLNGADKFFNGTSAVNPAVTQAVKVDGQGNVVERIHPMQPQGWYGVTRDAKFIAYFRTLHLPPAVALTALYTIGVIQLLLGSLFLTLLYRATQRPSSQPRNRAFQTRALHRVAFKGSALIFYVFCVGDILFGDRMELWEHGTYLLLTLITWEAWHRADQHSAAAADRDAQAHAEAAAAAPAPRRHAGALP